jgi:signal transduction histidine kinase/ActR/RegA family two-component response regulator
MNRIAKLHLGDTPSAEWQGRPVAGLLESLATRVQGGTERLHELHGLRTQGQLLSDVEIEIVGPEPRQLVLFSSPVATLEGASLGYVWVSRDVTEERRLQADLARSQRLDTIGRLAGGIAHDFNNQLTTILGNAKLLEDKATDPASRGSLDDLVLAAEHCGRLTRSLLSFARDSQFPPSVLSVQSVLDQVQQLLRPLLPATIELRVHVDDDTRPIAADPTQLHQVLVNLAINARDAISGVGQIEIRARNQVEEGAAPMVEIAVVDNGSGIESHVVERIFEPFFTTKSSTEGTGLGLAIVESVVMTHGGTIAVESNTGEGTTILIQWPAGEQVSDGASIDRSRRISAEGSETILIADDERGLRRLGRNILEAEGYSVVEAADGQEAIDRFVEQREEIGLVILDIMMPEVTGIEALDRIRELDETIPAILVSGLESPSPIDSAVAETIFLLKPYDNHELVEKVRQLLDSAVRER